MRDKDKFEVWFMKFLVIAILVVAGCILLMVINAASLP